MRVKTWVQIEQEVEVDVSIADVMSAIGALCSDDILPMVLGGINQVYSFLRHIGDERIAAMTPAQRKIIGDALREQAARYSDAERRAELAEAANVQETTAQGGIHGKG